MTPALLLLPRTVVCYSESLLDPPFWTAVRNTVGTLIEIALDLCISFGSVAILTILFLPIQE